MFYLDLLRAIAILLITNSHLEALYPWPILATGGMFGNELFFFISGYGLSLSLGKRQQKFAPWIVKRFKRVYEPLVIVTTFLLLVGFYKPISPEHLAVLYSGIATYWFLPIIMIFYFPLYFVLTRQNGRWAFAWAVSVALVCYAIAYLTVVDLGRFSVESHVLSKAPFYFIIMLLGALSARHRETVRPRWPDFALLAFASAAYLAGQFAMRTYGLFEFQFVIHLIGIGWIVAVYRCIRHPAFSLLEGRIPGRVVVFLSSIALQIYLLQELLIDNATIRMVPFPLDILVFWLAILPMAWAFKKVSFGDARKFFSRQETGAATKA